MAIYLYFFLERSWMAIRRRGSSYKARPSNIDSLLLLG
jgi:hypothetical protein